MESKPFESLDSAAVADAVRSRYAEGAGQREVELCCPVSYDSRWLDVIPQEILERDYGCGDPSRYLRSGETVLDLGSGGGKICFIASQVVGPEGRVIGVDMTPEMLALARRHQPTVAQAIGWDNVEFRRGRIEDLGLDQDRLEAWLRGNPVRDLAGHEALALEIDRLRREAPLIADASIDVVVSNCVLNLVAPVAKRRLFDEVFRVLRPGGRAVISDIVSQREVPERLQQDTELWSGCISGALTEDAFLQAFEAAGFHGIRILNRQSEAWRVVEQIEFRSVTIEAFKSESSACCETGQSVIYHGPFVEVRDEQDQLFRRGERTLVDSASFARLGREPYAGLFTRLSAEGETAPMASQVDIVPEGKTSGNSMECCG